jgi:hypothetical protein
MPIIDSGTFEMHVGSLLSQSGPWTLMGAAASIVDGVVADGDGKYVEMTKTEEHECPPGTVIHTWIPPGVHSIAFLLDNSEVILDADPPIDYLVLPAGWVATGMTVRWKVARQQDSGGGSLVAFKVFRDGTEIFADADDNQTGAAYQTANDVPADLLSAMNGPIRFEWELDDTVTTNFGCGAFDYVDLSTFITHLYATGTYDIVAYWWRIPQVSACGDRQESHLQLSSDDPGAPWERLDPDDDDAAPVPVVEHVTPNHVPIAGGVGITIDGSGFGDGCTVDVDGVPATDVVVVSQFQITCTAPAHAAGLTTVTVTNEDGVSS